ncbi:MAG: stage II sporulation protein M [Archaeoglobaceae archaeon]
MIIRIFALLTVVFFAAAAFGYAKGGELFELLKKFFESFSPYFDDPVKLALIIFVNNATKSFAAMLGGFFFGIYPIFFVASNGYILGAVAAASAAQRGWYATLLAILPHGIIEIPAVILASAYGVYLGYRFALALFKGEEFKKHLFEALTVYLRIILPMLFLAALIEAFITPRIAGVA